MKIYIASPTSLYDNKRYTGLRIINPSTKEIDDEYEREVLAGFLRGRVFGKITPLTPSWSPQLVTVFDPSKEMTDIDFFGSSDALYFSLEAAKKLEPLLLACGELLPLEGETQPFFVYNVLNIIEALDHDIAKTTLWQESERTKYRYTSKLDMYGFHNDRIMETPIFVIPEQGKYFFTDLFKTAVEANHLTGLCFFLIWDSDDPDYHDERYEEEQWEYIKRLYGFSHPKLAEPIHPTNSHEALRLAKEIIAARKKTLSS